jgi:hypothetical protein
MLKFYFIDKLVIKHELTLTLLLLITVHISVHWSQIFFIQEKREVGLQTIIAVKHFI